MSPARRKSSSQRSSLFSNYTNLSLKLYVTWKKTLWSQKEHRLLKGLLRKLYAPKSLMFAFLFLKLVMTCWSSVSVVQMQVTGFRSTRQKYITLVSFSLWGYNYAIVLFLWISDRYAALPHMYPTRHTCSWIMKFMFRNLQQNNRHFITRMKKRRFRFSPTINNPWALAIPLSQVNYLLETK